MKVHKVKIWPDYFAAVHSGRKTFELRLNDRDYKSDDVIVLREWSPITEKYTGYSITMSIGYIAKFNGDHVALSLLPPRREQINAANVEFSTARRKKEK